MDQMNQRMKYEAQYTSARRNLLLVVIMTAVNFLLLFLEADIQFLFSAIFPYLAVMYGWLLDGLLYTGVFTWVAVALVLVVLGIYLLCFFLSKKHPGWMTAALVLFSIDCLLVGYWIYLGAMLDDILTVVFHIWIMVYLVMGVRAAKKLKALPPQPEAPVAAPAPTFMPDASPAPQPVPQFEVPVPPAAPVEPEAKQPEREAE